MKKLLIASTALVATSGFAYADVTLGGSAQFGVIYQEDRLDQGLTDDSTDELFLDYELQFDFSASGETDSGIGFGMSAELESDSGGTSKQSPQAFDPEIFVTGSFGTVTVGALDVAPDQAGFGNTRDPGYDGIGIDNAIDAILFLGLSDFDDVFGTVDSGASANIMYQGSFGGLAITATVDSYEEDYAIVVGYDFGSFNVGFLYNEADDLGGGFSADTTALTAGTSFAGFDLDFVYAMHDNSDDIEIDAYGLSGAYDMGAYALTFAVNQVDVDNGPSGTSYGVGVAYDLGGGASLQAGIGSEYLLVGETFTGGMRDIVVLDDNRTVASFGIAMSF